MVELVALVMASASLIVCIALAAKLQRMESLVAISRPLDLPPEPPSLPEVRQSPLEGLRIALAITQDHAHPIFANLLKEHLLTEDVTEIAMLSPSEMAALKQDWNDGPDILISGDIVCNGYAEIYYQADLVCSTPHQAICTLIERPPHGDRPSNLCLELVKRLSVELEKLMTRNERRLAIRELRDGP